MKLILKNVNPFVPVDPTGSASSGSTKSSTAAHMELYTTSSYNETMSSISEKSSAQEVEQMHLHHQQVQQQVQQQMPNGSCVHQQAPDYNCYPVSNFKIC